MKDGVKLFTKNIGHYIFILGYSREEKLINKLDARRKHNLDEHLKPKLPHMAPKRINAGTCTGTGLSNILL